MTSMKENGKDTEIKPPFIFNRHFWIEKNK
jgi:hypothetical protein